MEDNQQPTRQLHGYVSATARDGWYRFAEKHGTSVTALLEATGLQLAQEARKPAKNLQPWVRRLISEAQAIASLRSSRQRRERPSR